LPLGARPADASLTVRYVGLTPHLPVVNPSELRRGRPAGRPFHSVGAGRRRWPWNPPAVAYPTGQRPRRGRGTGDQYVLGWTLLVLAGMPGLWLWTLVARRARRRHPTPPVPKRSEQPERSQSEGRAAAEVAPVFPVQRGRITVRIFRARVPLGPSRATPSLAAPAHRRAVAREAESVAEDAAAEHHHGQ
jgi:hypothetical protein